jgi:2-amino-4-hydroxy-6-hydroxymethyldihydropteridine diphosphokinase
MGGRSALTVVSSSFQFPVSRPVVVVAFGSNLGDRERQIRAAARKVAEFLSDFRLSSIIETAPVGAALEHDPPFLNAIGVGQSTLPPQALLERLQAVERAAGRTRPYRGAPRTIDLDLILTGDAMVNEEGLQVPHPRFRERRFVLQPLVELEPNLKDPATGRTMRELLARLTP